MMVHLAVDPYRLLPGIPAIIPPHPAGAAGVNADTGGDDQPHQFAWFSVVTTVT